MSIDSAIDVPLTDDERSLLLYGLREWGGPAHCTDAMAFAMGFQDVADLFSVSDRLRDALRTRQPLSQRDWVRTLLATEVVFASDVVGAGLDWSTATGLRDEDTIRVLRSLQRKIPKAGVLRAMFVADGA